MKGRIYGIFAPLLANPVVRRAGWHLRRVRGQIDLRFFRSLAIGALVLIVITSILVTVAEKEVTIGSLLASMNWAIQTMLGQGDSSYVTTPVGFVIGWLFSLFGLAIVGTITGALVALLIDFLLKEGQGMGASGYGGHIIVCGWNSTARDLIAELRGDEYGAKVAVVHGSDRNPAGDGVYFVKGDPTNADDLARAGIADASAALIFPVDRTDDADMRSILTVMAIESVAPHVRTVAEVNNPRHVDHFLRAHVDEVLVTSTLASRLLARSALYPGLTGLVTDIVSGGRGSELYRIVIPADYLGLSIDEASARLRAEHRATLLAIHRGDTAIVNPPADFALAEGDDALVVAESLGTLAPLRIGRARPVPQPA